MGRYKRVNEINFEERPEFTMIVTWETRNEESRGFGLPRKRKKPSDGSRSRDSFPAVSGASSRAEKAPAASGGPETWASLGADVRYVGSFRSDLIMRDRDIDMHVYTKDLDVAATNGGSGGVVPLETVMESGA